MDHKIASIRRGSNPRHAELEQSASLHGQRQCPGPDLGVVDDVLQRLARVAARHDVGVAHVRAELLHLRQL